MSTVFNFTFVPWFRSVAPYIHMHRGKTFVVGVVGEAIAAGKLGNIATDLALIQSMGVPAWGRATWHSKIDSVWRLMVGRQRSNRLEN